MDNIVSRGGKAALITGGVVAGIAAIGILANNSRRRARRNAQQDIANADLMQPDMPIMPPAPPMEMGPADGRLQNEWQQRIMAQRGMGRGQPEGPAQPAQNVMPEESVQPLGASQPPSR